MKNWLMIGCLATLSAGQGVLAAEAENRVLAARAKAILKANCHRCHGENGTVEGGFNYVLDRGQLVNRKRVVPGDLKKSRLLQRVLSEEMPPEGEKPRPSAAEVALLRQWIEAGAPDFDPPMAERPFIAPALVLQSICEDLDQLP